MNAKPTKRKTDSLKTDSIVTAAGAIRKIKADSAVKPVKAAKAAPGQVRDTRAREITDDDVARRAYARYCERGGRNGSDMNDWLEAERELRTAAASMAT